MAKQHNAHSQGRLSVDSQAYRLLVETLSSGSTDIRELLAATAPSWLLSEKRQLREKNYALSSEGKSLPTMVRTLDAQTTPLAEKAHALSGRAITLPDDPKGLSDIYRSALLSSNAQRNLSLQ